MSKPKSQQKEKGRYRFYPVGVQHAAVERMKFGCNVSALAEELEVNRTTLYYWMRKSKDGQPASAEIASIDPALHRIQELIQKVAEQEGVIGRQALEISFFKDALRRIEESRQKKSRRGENVFTKKSES